MMGLIRSREDAHSAAQELMRLSAHAPTMRPEIEECIYDACRFIWAEEHIDLLVKHGIAPEEKDEADASKAFERFRSRHNRLIEQRS